ncbi:hypothetical protein SSYRP_v1c02720 [Spiroplasma syrphidicola EA-1]|uniref:Pycsar effector protein domain-containing protein n=1 Tax=Spiroplasma syrphidicola EA-1 TaxID=1276229 RepID=R4U5K0_9MOLU|nr:hypothetical protein [Spiroplasma syrphidicola]AGM25868.1 hypothetical protein SSYRP_v1c02720 [Spiroplasma syrphidicola EA-1]
MINKNEKIIDLDIIFENNRKISNYAETKSYYALVLLGLLSVPLFTLFVEMLNLKLFNFWYNKLLFIFSLILLVLSFFSLIFSFIPRIVIKSKKQRKNIVEVSNAFKNDYYHYQFWSDIKYFNLLEIENFLSSLKIEVIGNINLLSQIINLAWIAKIKFRAFNISIILQMLLIITMIALSIILILT